MDTTVQPVEVTWRPLGLLLLVALNVGDLLSTRSAIAAGGRELNPLAGWALAHGFAGLLMVKAAVLAGVVGIVMYAGIHRPARAARLVWLAVLLYGAVVVWNSSEVLVRRWA